MIGSIIVLLILLILYCCVVQGKQADKAIDRLYWEVRGTDIGKDEE